MDGIVPYFIADIQTSPFRQLKICTFYLVFFETRLAKFLGRLDMMGLKNRCTDIGIIFKINNKCWSK